MKVTRRDLLASAAGVVALGTPGVTGTQSPAPTLDPSKVRGKPQCDRPARAVQEAPAASARHVVADAAPGIIGTITPSDLHFERHQPACPTIDPRRYSLLVHGMVDRPMTFTLADLKRFPSRHADPSSSAPAISAAAHRGDDAAALAGLTSKSEWTGVLLATLLREVGVQPQRDMVPRRRAATPRC